MTILPAPSRAVPPPRLAALLVARLDSARLPGKALLDAGGRPLIAWALERLRRCPAFGDHHPIVLATTARPVDDPLADWARSAEIGLWRDAGDPGDVAGRLVRAGEALGAAWVFRVNADSPLVDPGLLLEGVRTIEALHARGEGDRFDLVTNLEPRLDPYGVAVEGVRVAGLRSVLDSALTGCSSAREAREHATQLLYAPERGGRRKALGAPDRADLSRVRVTVDTPTDLSRFRAFLARSPGGSWLDRPAHALALDPAWGEPDAHPAPARAHAPAA